MSYRCGKGCELVEWLTKKCGTAFERKDVFEGDRVKVNRTFDLDFVHHASLGERACLVTCTASIGDSLPQNSVLSA